MSETPSGDVPSPCNGVCRIQKELCRGCLRTVDEITQWSLMTLEQKRQTWEMIRARRENRARERRNASASPQTDERCSA